MSEVLASLSLATDLGTGQPLGHGLRTCLLSVRLAQAMGVDSDVVRSVHHVALLRFLGCTADSAETARMAGGDDAGFNATMAPVFNGTSLEMMRGLVSAVGPGRPAARRARMLASVLADSGETARSLGAHCEVASMLARRLDLDERVTMALEHGYERWDGKGYPGGLAGQQIPLEIRIVTVARDADVTARAGADVRQLLQRRRGKAYDPTVVDAFGDLDTDGVEADWAEVIDTEPEPIAQVHDIDRVLTVLSDFVDLKSPWMRGHSSRVAELAAAAAYEADLGPDEIERLRRAGLVHDIGRVGVENGVWDKPSSLASDEWEKVWTHPYLTHRILSRCPALEPMGALASSHHERLDGSGYHRGARDGSLSASDRILAAADALASLGSDRPHRKAHDFDASIDALRAEAAAGRLDHKAVECVIAAAGGEAQITWENPADLTEREIEVLTLISRGLTNREVADELFISAKTVGRHIENLYAKIGVSSRAAAAVFAMENHLLN